jgi:RsiW-degrading membrane proteinase PrsW (M82 family)
MDAKSLVIGALAVAVAVLGYFYYENQRTTVKIDLPGVKIEGK